MKKIAMALYFLVIPVMACSKNSPSPKVPSKVSLQDKGTTKLPPQGKKNALARRQVVLEHEH